MTPLPDRVVVLGLVITVALCFALVFWSVKLNPRPEPQLQWRERPAAPAGRWQPGSSQAVL